MTRSAAERAAISRQNGQKSKGPRSPEGKDRSRFNALKHGLKAKVLVLPGEDAQQYQDRLDAWIADWQPANDVEHSLVERAVTLTWQLDRAERAETARLAALIRAAPAEEARRQEDEAHALGQRLFFDRRGPVPLYPHSLYIFPDRPRTSFSGLSDDPDDPPRLLLRLEATAAGCQWLLDRWAELGALLDRGLSWQSPDKLRAIRLLGHQPLDAADSEVVATIFQACHVLDPQTHHQAGIAADEAEILTEAIRTLKTMNSGGCARLPDQPGSHDAAESLLDEEPDEPVTEDVEADEEAEARLAWQRCGAAFTELLGELTAEEGDEYRRRLEDRRVDELRPQDPAAARATLRAIVEKAVIRLEAKREVHAAHDMLEAATAVDRLYFDESAEGEHLRRFQLAGQRALLRTVDSLLKLRRSGTQGPTVAAPAEPAGSGTIVDGRSATIWCGPEGIDSCFGSHVLLAGPDLLAGPLSAPEPEPDTQNETNELPCPPGAPNPMKIAACVHGRGGQPLFSEEPTAALGDSPSAPAGSPAAPGEHRISLIEPTTPASKVPVVPDESAISADDPGPQQEPAGRQRSDSPPAASAAIGKATDARTNPTATLARSAQRADSLPNGP